MRIYDSNGTHTFSSKNSSDIDDYSTITRDIVYKNISLLVSTSNIGTDKNITINFYQLTRSELTELNLIFTTNKSNNNSITQIDNYDEVISGETYTKLLGATNGIFIETKKWKQKKSIYSKDIKYWNVRLIFRFDTATEHIK